MKAFMLKKSFVLALLIILFSTNTKAQNVPFHDIALQNVGGNVKVVASAVITVCAGIHTEIPCAPTTTIFQANGAQAQNPFNADANGNFTFYATQATNYTVSITGVGVNGYSFPFFAPVVSGAGSVVSVFGRSGAIVAQAGDYNFSQLTGTLLGAQFGPLTGDVTTSNFVATLANSGATAGSCGGASSSCALSVDVKGRVTSRVDTPLAAVSSVNVTAPVQYTVTGCPITTSGTCAINWNNQYPNTVLGGPSTSGLGGIFDGAVIGTANTATSLPLSLKPNTTSDIAFFHVSSSFIGQPSAVTVTGTGTWTTEVPNGNVGGLFRQLLTSSSLLTATANLTNATNFAGSMFFLQTSGTPVFVQNKGTTGGIVNGTQLVFTGNTTIGNAILVVLNGTPPSAVSINATISDSQGNAFTPVSYVQNGSSAVATAWLTTNIRAATLDTITLQTTTGTVGAGSFYMVEITNIAPQSPQPSFQVLTPGHVKSFMQAAIAQVTTCPTVAAAGSICTYTLTWPIPWPDATYAASCMGTTPVQFPVIQGVVNTTTQTVITVENGTANEAQISGYTDMRCIGMSTH